MALMRATAKDYDIWAELGGKGSTWNWKGIFPYFKKVSQR
jgi:choline dehydrogenase-like flavoprotein